MKNELFDYQKPSPEMVIQLLQQGSKHIMTSCMISAVSPAIEAANSKGYKVSMMRSDDPSDPGGIMSMVGTFYFDAGS